MSRLCLRLIAGLSCSLVGIPLVYAATIEFGEPAPAAVTSYTEQGVTFTSRNWDHFHPGGNLQFHSGDQVVRMTYDPNQDGVLDRFNLLGLDVVSESDVVNVHAEIDHSGVNGTVYGPFGQGTWTLDSPGNRGLLFAAFACPSGTDCTFAPTIDNVIFTAASGTGPTGQCEGLAATIVGTAGNDTMFGTWARDVINGLGGNDSITDYGGDDVICGGTGNDTLAMPSTGFSSFANPTHNGNDRVNGGNGIDTVSFPGTASNAGVNVNLFRNTASGTRHGADTLAGIENATGSSVTDFLDGSSGTNILSGGAGNDSLDGVADPALNADADDTLNGGKGNDSMNGGRGTDTCNGGAGSADSATACERTTGVP